jgi:hypothetical protein
MILQEEISKHESDFKSLCQKHNVKLLCGFGSSVTNSFDNKSSDIDLLVEIDEADPIERGDKLISLWDNFESFFKRKADMLTESSIQNPYLKRSIDATKVLIYDGNSSKVFI